MLLVVVVIGLTCSQRGQKEMKVVHLDKPQTVMVSALLFTSYHR